MPFIRPVFTYSPFDYVFNEHIIKFLGLHNPETTVEILSITPAAHALPPYFKPLRNVHVTLLNFTSLASGTSLEQWYSSRVWDVPHLATRIFFLSDTFRLAYLFKHGGIYLDTDLITLKPFLNLPGHIANEFNLKLNNAFIALHAGHPFLKMVLDTLVSEFDPKNEELLGPYLLTRVYQQYQNKTEAKDYPVLTIPMEKIYPFQHDNVLEMLQPIADLKPERRKALDEAYTLHLWRSQMSGVHQNPRIIPPNDSALYEMAERHCGPVLKDWH